jgi:hypothetical protein
MYTLKDKVFPMMQYLAVFVTVPGVPPVQAKVGVHAFHEPIFDRTLDSLASLSSST